MADKVMEKIKSTEVAHFLKTATDTFNRIGKGVTSAGMSYGVQTNTEQYIDEENATTTVDAYQVSIAGEQTCYRGEPIFAYIDGIRRARGTGSACETEMLTVYVYEKSGEDAYIAEKNNVAIAISDFNTEGGQPVKISYTIYANGDPVIGTATIDRATKTATFTATNG